MSSPDAGPTLRPEDVDGNSASKMAHPGTHNSSGRGSPSETHKPATAPVAASTTAPEMAESPLKSQPKEPVISIGDVGSEGGNSPASETTTSAASLANVETLGRDLQRTLLNVPAGPLPDDSASEADFQDANDEDCSEANDRRGDESRERVSENDALEKNELTSTPSNKTQTSALPGLESTAPKGSSEEQPGDRESEGDTAAVGEVTGEVASKLTEQQAHKPEREDSATRDNGNGFGGDDDDDDDFGDFGEADPEAADEDDFGDFGEADQEEKEEEPPAEEPFVSPFPNLKFPQFTDEELETHESFTRALRPCLNLLFPDAIRFMDNPPPPPPENEDPPPSLVSERGRELWKKLSRPIPPTTLKWEDSLIRQKFYEAMDDLASVDAPKREGEKGNKNEKEEEKSEGKEEEKEKKVEDERRDAQETPAKDAAKPPQSQPQPSADVSRAASTDGRRASSSSTPAGRLLAVSSRAASPSPVRKSESQSTGASSAGPPVDISRVDALTAVTIAQMGAFSESQLKDHVESVRTALEEVDTAVEYWEKEAKKAQEGTDALEQLIGNLIRQIQKLKG